MHETESQRNLFTGSLLTKKNHTGPKYLLSK